MNSDLKKLYCYQAIVDVLVTFAEMEFGENVELDTDRVYEYLNSSRWFADQLDCSTKDEFYKMFTDDILNGCPVWQFFKLSEWQLHMLETEFATKLAKEEIAKKKKYKCLTCDNYSKTDTPFGSIEYCKAKLRKTKTRNSWGAREEGVLSCYRQECKNYIQKME